MVDFAVTLHGVLNDPGQQHGIVGFSVPGEDSNLRIVIIDHFYSLQKEESIDRKRDFGKRCQSSNWHGIAFNGILTARWVLQLAEELSINLACV